MSLAMIIGAATSRVRGRAGRAAPQRVAAGTAVSPPDRTLLLLLALYACWGSAIPAMKLMVDTVPPLGGAALLFLVAGVVLAAAGVGGRRPARAAAGRGPRRRVAAGGWARARDGGADRGDRQSRRDPRGDDPAVGRALEPVIGTPGSAASQVRLAAGFGGIAIVVLTAPNSAIGGEPWAVAAFVVAPILWAAGSLLTAHGDRPADRVVANAVQLLAGGTVLLLLVLSLGELIRLVGRTSV